MHIIEDVQMLIKVLEEVVMMVDAWPIVPGSTADKEITPIKNKVQAGIDFLHKVGL